MSRLTADSENGGISIWHRFVRPFGENRAGVSRSGRPAPTPENIASARALIAEASAVDQSELDGIEPKILVDMAREPDVMRRLKHGGDVRRWEQLAENT